LSRDSLVCPEAASGAVEKDWRALSSVAELTDIFSSAGGLPAASTLAADSFDDFSRSAHDAIEKIGRLEEFGTSLISDPRLLEALGESAPWQSPDDQLDADRSHILELEDRLTQLKGQIEGYERKQDEILEHLSAKDKLLHEKDRELDELRARVEELLKRPPPVSASAAPPVADPPVEAKPLFEAPPPKSDPEPEPALPPPPPPPLPKEEAQAKPPEPASAPKSIAGIEIVPFADFEPTQSARQRRGPAPLEEESEARGQPARRRTEEAPPPMDIGAPPAADITASDMAPAPVPGIEEEPPPAAAPAAHEPDASPEAAQPNPFDRETLRASSELPDGMEFVPPLPEEAALSMPAEMAPVQPEPLPTPAALDAPVPSGQEPVLGEGAATAGQAAAPETVMFPPPEEQSEAAALPETGVIAPPGEAGTTGEIPLTAPPKNIFEDQPVQAPATDLNMTPPLIAGAPAAEPIPGMGQLLPGQLPTPIPIPLGGATPFPGQFQTPMPTMGQPDLPQSVMAGLGVQPTATPTPLGQTTPGPDIGGQSFEDLMGKPPTVSVGLTNAPGLTNPPGLTNTPLTPGTQPPSLGSVPSTVQKDEPQQPKLKSKKFLVGMAAAGLSLMLIMVFFLRNPKQVSKMVDMSPEQKAAGELAVEGQQGAAEPTRQPVQTQPPGGGQFQFPRESDQQPEETSPAEPAPQQPAAQSRDFIMDQRIAAIEFVKDYPLDSERGSISQWLDYAFLTPGHTPEWTAGAVEMNIWIVEFNVFRGARSRKPRVAYQFEVNMAEKTLIGRNTAAKDLLSGGTSKPAEEPKPRAAEPKPRAISQGRPRKTASRTISHTVQDEEQEPLPEEEELDQSVVQSPPRFNNPAAP
jgi:hypothetical protein